MKSFSYNPIFVPKYIFQSFFSFFFIRILFLLMLQSLISQEYVTQSFKTSAYDSSYNIPLQIIEDKKGFLWYTTHNGLVHELGTQTFFHSLKTHPDEVVDIKNFISLYEDRSGMIWVLTLNDIRTFNPTTKKVESFNLIHPENKLPLIPTSVVQLSNGVIYFGTQSNFIVAFNPLNQQFDYVNLYDSDIEGKKTDIIGSKNNILIVKSPKEVLVLDADNKLSPKQRFESKGAKALVLEAENDFDLGFQGQYFYNKQAYQYFFISSINGYIIEFPNTAIDISKPLLKAAFLLQTSTNSLGFFGLTKEKGKLSLEQKNTFTFNSPIQDIYLGNKKIIWISGTDEVSKLVLQKRQFNSYLNQNTLDDKTEVGAIVQNSTGTYFIATANGIYKKEGGEKFQLISLTNKNKPLQKTPYFKDLWVQNDSLIWGVDQSDSVYKMDLNNRTVTEYSINNNTTFNRYKFVHLASKSENEMYLGGLEGLYSFNTETNTFKDENKGFTGVDFSSFSVYDTLENENYFWVASVAGLYRVDKKQQKSRLFVNEGILSSSKGIKFTILHESNDGSLWAGSDHGLFKINQETCQLLDYFDESKGMIHSEIRGIQESGQFIWTTTSKGLSKINWTNNQIQNFHENQGLLDVNFTPNTFYKASDSLLFSGTSSGIVSFNPNLVFRSNIDYTIYPVELRYFDKKRNRFFSVTSNFNNYQTIDLPNAYSSLFFSFAMNDLITPELNNIFYRISSLSPEWILLDSDFTVKLFGLQSGKYTLEIKGTSELGSPSQNMLTYAINVPYPFYFQWWFVFVVFFLIAIVLYLWFYFETTVLKINRDRQLQIANLELRAYQAQMNPHFIFNALNGLQSTMVLQGEKAFNNYMGAFSKLIRHTFEMSDTDQITLLKEIEYLKNYVALQSLRLDTEIDLKISAQKPIVSSFVYLPCMILQPIVENAILHGLMASKKDREITIHFFFEDGYLNCQIKDNGIGREAAQKRNQVYQSTHQSFATTILNQRIKLLNSKNKGNFFFHIEDLYDEQGQAAGTLVTVGIPIDYDPEN